MKITGYLMLMFFFLTLASCSSSKPNPPQKKSETIVIPVSILGKESETRRKFLQNTLNEELSKQFRIVPQKRFEAAQEQAFQEMEYDQCTEEQCFMLIQEFLQVPYLFHLEVIAEDNLVQLSLKFLDPDKQKTLTDTCEDCSTLDLSERLRRLTNRLLKEKDLLEFEVDEDEKMESTSHEDQHSQKKLPRKDDVSRNFQISGIYGNYSKNDLSIKKMSYAFSWKGFGLGLSNFEQKMESSTGNQYHVEANFIDSSISIGQRLTGMAGIGWAASGKAKIDSALQTYQSQQTYGFRYFGLLGYQWETLEMMIGYQYHQLRYRDMTSKNSGFKLTNPLYVFGWLMLVGIGVEF